MVRHGVRRLSWGLIDQGGSSLSTLCVSVGVLHGPTAGAREFAIVFLMHSLAIGFSRSITTEPVAQDLALFPRARVRAVVRGSGFTGAAVGLVTALLALVILRPATPVGLWSLAFPLTVVGVDSVRAAWIGARLAAVAVRYSAAQVVAAAAGLLLTLLTGNAVWALAPIVVVSAVLTLATFIAGPALSRAELVPRHGFYAGEWLFTSGLSQSSGLVAAQALPLLPLLLRAQGVLFGPLSPLAQAVAALAVPEFATLRRRRPSLVGPAAALTAGLMLTAAVYAGLLLLVPESVLAHLLGETWQQYRPILLPSIAMVIASNAPMSPLVALRAHGYARTSLGLTVAIGTGHLLLPLAGAFVAGIPGFFWGAALSSVIGCVLSMITLRRAEQRRRDTRVGEPA